MKTLWSVFFKNILAPLVVGGLLLGVGAYLVFEFGCGGLSF